MFLNVNVPLHGGVIDVAALRELIHQQTGIEPARQLLICNRRLLRGNGSINVAERHPDIEVYARPGANRVLWVRTHVGGEAVRSTYGANTPVSELKRFLARRYQLAPSRLVLTTLGVTMEEEDPLGEYAADGRVEVAVSVEDDGEPAQLVLVSVRHRDGPGSVTFTMDARDTFDVLLGKMEKAGMVTKGEEVTLVSGDVLFENWRTFGDYQLTHVKLRILE